jgi:hypothetical protein
MHNPNNMKRTAAYTNPRRKQSCATFPKMTGNARGKAPDPKQGAKSVTSFLAGEGDLKRRRRRFEDSLRAVAPVLAVAIGEAARRDPAGFGAWSLPAWLRTFAFFVVDPASADAAAAEAPDPEPWKVETVAAWLVASNELRKCKTIGAALNAAACVCGR